MNCLRCLGYFSLADMLCKCGVLCAIVMIGVGGLVGGKVAGAPLTYDIGVVNLAPPGSAPNYVVTGTITTNGALGRLIPSDIVSWSIAVNGPRDYTFHPGNPGALIDPQRVFASLTTLETSGQFGALWFYANENTLPNCTDCRENLGWRGFAGDVVYYYYDSADNDPTFAYALADLGSVYSTTIATRVPEPVGFSMALLSTAIFVSSWRRR